MFSCTAHYNEMNILFGKINNLKMNYNVIDQVYKYIIYIKERKLKVSEAVSEHLKPQIL